jgi:hypothetical protein
MLTYKTKAIRNEFGQLTPIMQLFVYGLAALFWVISGKTQVVTALIAGGHDPNGLHPLGRAVDLRSKHLSNWAKQRCLSAAKGVIGLFGGVAILEASGTDNEHFHIQV